MGGNGRNLASETKSAARHGLIRVTFSPSAIKLNNFQCGRSPFVERNVFLRTMEHGSRQNTLMTALRGMLLYYLLLIAPAADES